MFDASQLVTPPEAPFPRLPEGAQEQFEVVCQAVMRSHIGVLERRLPKGVDGLQDKDQDLDP